MFAHALASGGKPDRNVKNTANWKNAGTRRSVSFRTRRNNISAGVQRSSCAPVCVKSPPTSFELISIAAIVDGGIQGEARQYAATAMKITNLISRVIGLARTYAAIPSAKPKAPIQFVRATAVKLSAARAKYGARLRST